MKRKVLVFIVSLLILTSVVGVVMAESDEANTGATVIVNEFVSITLSDPTGDIEVDFDALDPGTDDNPDLEQSTGQTTAAITVTNDVVSNVDVNVDVKGTVFSDGTNTIAVSQVTYDDDGDASQGTETGSAETPLATDYPETPYYSNVAPENSVGFWFFLNVPTSQTAGTYTSTFYFEGNTA